MGTNHNTIDFSNSYLKDFIVYQDQNLTSTCETYLRTFQFPVFELLLFLQVSFKKVNTFIMYFKVKNWLSNFPDTFPRSVFIHDPLYFFILHRMLHWHYPGRRTSPPGLD